MAYNMILVGRTWYYCLIMIVAHASFLFSLPVLRIRLTKREGLAKDYPSRASYNS